MKTENQYLTLAHMVLPTGILEWFDIVDVEEQITDPTGKATFVGIIHIHLDEAKHVGTALQELRPNGFTEASVITDFPIRDRKLKLHIRRRRWLDRDGHNVVLDLYPLVADGTRYSPEFAAFLKEASRYESGDSESVVKALGG